MNALEKRVAKLDKQVALLPCPKHNDLTVFIVKHGEDGPDAATQAKIDVLRACKLCRNKLFIFIMHFGKEDAGQPAKGSYGN